MLNLAPNEREQLQLERLQATLNRAYRNVPFHQNRQNLVAGRNGKDPSAIERVEDIAALPFMERKHLGEHYPYGLFAVPLKDIVRIHTAPGTTRHPTVTGYTRQDLRMWREMVGRAFTAAGITSEDILQIDLDPGLANWGRDYKDGAESMDVAVIPNTPLSPSKQLMVLRDYKTSALVTTPSRAIQLTDLMFKAELNPTALNLKRLILVGEPLMPEVRRRLESRLHVETWHQFGLSEVPGPAIAFECRDHHGLHINEDHFLPEIVDPVSGDVLPRGETGELVLTTLTTRAFPLIRFRTGEKARLMADTCPCGTTFLKLEWFEDRTDDILNINGVKVHPSQITRHIEDALSFVPKYRAAVREAEGEKKLLEAAIAMDDRLFSDEIKILEKRIHQLESSLRENLGVPVRIRLMETSLL
ncbi:MULTISPECIES: phenylacetate--CoA ligase family protein [Desulfococcus]|uniref:AMP-dependent synthetase and ligase n=1 Tax=Desulfococcus multivorans DSM 2059 TaxID=1121405 RepID=S7U6Z5_DESML|nr:AMP-binding protein [Desulfococcus multivorans]AOY59078.1 PadJ2: phenylacetate-coenzyme A ligase [Desulfococcus multivorans]AQV01325.1 phenylacetate--CoA ligase [Desulfococcus multivorans]EPR44890.1 AMP-dependent synthetase and ligase [Desulfococcus multivorans DSM 2059]SJZ82685.1 phenylacetate-CoA ligase [Desulfococcus multivorans DSM 2059]